MLSSACFLGTFGGMPCRHATFHSISSTEKYLPLLQVRKRKRHALRCVHGKDQTDGQSPNLEDEFRTVVQTSMQSENESNIQESDRRIVDGITETGVKEIEGIANEVKDDLEDLQRLVEGNVDMLIEEETQQALKSYDQKQKELLANVEKDREVIAQEIERINELAKSVEGGSGLNGSKTLREKAYFIMCAIFTVSAFYSAWKGLVDADSAALKNAVIDAVVAAACTYFYSKETSKK